MKILVTGATGFIGNYVIEQLLSDHVDIIATSTNIDKAKSKDWFDKVTFIPFSLSEVNGEHLNLYEAFGKPDKVIHLAWGGLPNYKSLHHFEKELFCQYAFLKNLVQNGAKDITVTGTCFEYGMQQGCLSEDMATQPSNPYALAKDTLRKFLQELQKTERFSLKWVRLFYMYGKGQSPNSLLSQLDKALEEGEMVFNMSGGEQLRDYLPVKDVAKNIIGIATQDDIQGIINCCSGEPAPVKKFVENYLNKINQTIKLNLGYYPYSDLEPFAFWGDTKKLKAIVCIQN